MYRFLLMLKMPYLADVGILDLLRHDDRPTFVLGPDGTGGKQPHNHVAFRNAALDAFLSQHAQITAFEAWSRSLAIHSREHAWQWDFAGRAWTGTLVGDVWFVVYCAQPALGTKKRQLDQHDEPSITARESTKRGPSWDILSPPPSESPKLVDWTRFDIPNLSSHTRFIKNFDWSSTPLGPIEQWSDSLRSMVVSISTNPDPRLIVWGEELILIYNESCAVKLGDKHPRAMGKSAAEVHAEIWPQMTSLLAPALIEGKAVKSTKELSFYKRNGILEETYWYVIQAKVGVPTNNAFQERGHIPNHWVRWVPYGCIGFTTRTYSPCHLSATTKSSREAE